MNGWPDDKDIRQKAHDEWSDNASHRAQRGDITRLVLRVAELILEVSGDPVVDAVVGKLDEEEGKRVGEHAWYAKGSPKRDVLYLFIVFYFCCVILLYICIIAAVPLLLLHLSWIEDVRLLSDLDAPLQGVLNQAEQIDDGYKFYESSKGDKSVSPVLSAALSEHEVESLAKNISNRRICGPYSNNDSSTLSRKPIAQNSEIYCPCKRLNCSIDCLDYEKVSGALILYWNELQAAKNKLSYRNQRVHNTDKLSFTVNVSKVRQEKTTKRICKQKCCIHVWHCIFWPVIEIQKVFSGHRPGRSSCMQDTIIDKGQQK